MTRKVPRSVDTSVEVDRIHVLASHATRAGGADIYTRRLVLGLTDRGWQVVLFCHTADPDVRSSCEVIELSRGQWHAVPWAWRFSSLLQLLSIYRSMRSAAVSTPPAAVIGSAHQILWAHRRLYGNVPLVCLPHSLVAPLEVASYPFLSRTMKSISVRFWESEERNALRRAAFTVRFARMACQALRSHYGPVGRDQMVVLPPPVDRPGVVPPRQTRETPRLLAVGRLVATKNFECLLRALAEMKDLEWTCDLLGDGPERRALARTIGRLGLSDRVTLHGHVAPAEFYARADVMAMPSVLESFSLVVSEALSYGVPVIAFRPDGRRVRTTTDECVNDGENGYLADNDHEFAAKLRQVVGDAALRERLSESAVRISSQSGHWPEHLAAMEQLLVEAARHR